MKAADPRFIACRAPYPDARIVLFGIPFEGTVNLRTGADRGPRDLRIASDSIETYSPVLERDLEDLGMADLRDADIKFIAADTGIERQHIVWLRTAAAQEVKVRPADGSSSRDMRGSRIGWCPKPMWRHEP